MRVILLANVKGVGQKNEVKNVADGYARNFLIARKLAVAADVAGMGVKMSADKKEQAEIDRLQELVKKLAVSPLTFSIKTGEHKEVFGSVSRRDIEQAIKKIGSSEGEVVLEHPIKSTGEHTVEIDFGKGVRGTLKVVIKAA
jgi:large subunit ribosomal protein L9